MKKAIVNIILVLSGLVLGVALCIIVGRAVLTKDEVPVSKSPAVSAASADSDCETLIDLAYEAAAYIRDGDYAALAAMTHPEYGLTFSPYANINLSTARCFTPSEVAAFGGDGASYVWGVYDGSGEPIDLTVKDYIGRFVFDLDFTKASVIGIDTVVKAGNFLENVQEAFPGARFIELHIPGDDINWRTLRFVFEQHDGEWKLSAIVHSEWTA